MATRKLSPKRQVMLQDVTVDENGFVIQTSIRLAEAGAEAKSSRPATRKVFESKPKEEIPPYVPYGPERPSSFVAHRRGRKSKKTTAPVHSTSSSSPSKRLLLKCPHCPSNVGAEKLEDHIARVHPQASKEPRHETPTAEGRLLVLCPQCNASVRQDRLDRHLRKVHRLQAHRASKPDSGTTRTSPGGSQLIIASKEGWEQDGGQYLGYFARENGQFGSIPLYDDHSDEAGAD